MGNRKRKRPLRCFASSNTLYRVMCFCQLLVFIEENVNSKYYGTFEEYSFVPVFQGPDYLH
jgi:hypothetical protein